MAVYILAIDQGTTSTRAIVFDERGRKCGTGQREFAQIYPQPGWVEHDAAGIWDDTVQVCREALAAAGIGAADLAACGITNQRETVVLWDRQTGAPVANAIVWQDRRTAEVCQQLREQVDAEDLAERTGLLLDPYFSATKIAWLLDQHPGLRARAEAGEIAFGTIDSWLIYKLTNGAVHVTDATNASRTLLFNIRTQAWDPALLATFRVPARMLPEVRDSACEFGRIAAEHLGAEVRIGAVLGDQQAATVGQACFTPGMIKSTYGTGCFVVLNTGAEFVRSRNRLLTTVAYRLNGEVCYALEGSIFIAGAAVQWLRDSLKLIGHAADTEALARSVESTQGVYLVPAFTGLGAPYWDPEARGALIGLTRASGFAEIARAALESVCYQTRDLVDAMSADAVPPRTLRVDGGMVANDWLVQYLADTLRIPIERPAVLETTALGAAYFAGLTAGVYGSLDDIAAQWQCDSRLLPGREEQKMNRRYAGWQDAVQRVLTRTD
ncbi:MAG: glycerol kinase GlpK [Oceanococcaceae bacterium]